MASNLNGPKTKIKTKRFFYINLFNIKMKANNIISA